MSLASYFLQNGTLITGTIGDTQEHFPVELKTMKLPKGEAAFYQHNGLVVVKDRAMKGRAAGKPKEVYVLSTAHAPAMGLTNKRDKDGNIIQKHGRVDVMDQQLDGIDVLRKSYKWYKKLFLRLLM